MEQLVSIFFLSLQPGGRHKNVMARMIYFLSRCGKNHSDFVQGSRSQAMAFLEGVNSTPHRAHLSRATHTIFLVVCMMLKRWSRHSVECSPARFLKVIPSHPCLTALCLTHNCLHIFLRFSYSCTWFVYLSLAVIPVDGSIHCPSAKRVMLWASGWSPHTQSWCLWVGRWSWDTSTSAEHISKE